MKSYARSNEGRTLTVRVGPLTRVEIYDEAGLYAVGYAKLNEDDEYNEDFGVFLAASRAEERYQRKFQKALIRGL